MTAALATVVCDVIYYTFAVSWIVTVVARILDKDNSATRLANTIGSELRPFVLPAAVAGYLASVVTNGITTGGLIVLAAQSYAWWASRNDFDDRWKRRGKRLVEKVQSAGHKLVVVEAGAES